MGNETSSLFRVRGRRTTLVALKFASTAADRRVDNYRAVRIWVGQEAQHGSEGTDVDFVLNG